MAALIGRIQLWYGVSAWFGFFLTSNCLITQMLQKHQTPRSPLWCNIWTKEWAKRMLSEMYLRTGELFRRSLRAFVCEVLTVTARYEVEMSE